MEICLHRECPSIDNRIPRVWEHGGWWSLSGVPVTGKVGSRLEGQWDPIVLSEVASDRAMGKSKMLFMAVL